MERPFTRGSEGERGFTLAALIVILSIMMIIVAYTVPKMWSAVLQREREQETVWVMRQYARAIWDFQHTHQAYPTSMDQLRKARQPRMIRWKDDPIDPLTGQVDWLVIPAATAQQGTPLNLQQGGGGQTSTTSTTGSTSTTGTSGKDANGNPTTPSIPAFPMKDYAGGPFVGIRSPKTGKSYLLFNGSDQYEQWNFTALDLNNEIMQRAQANAQVLGVGGVSGK